MSLSRASGPFSCFRVAVLLVVCVVSSSRLAFAAPLEPDSAVAPGSSAAEQPARERPAYRVAVGVSGALGDPGWGTELGSLIEVNARAQVLPWLGVGAAFFQLTAPNNEALKSTRAQALELNASAHPVIGSWFDPFVRLGAFDYVGFQSSGFDSEPHTRIGAEGQIGMNVALPHVAFGINLRQGIAARDFTLLGLQVEGRL